MRTSTEIQVEELELRRCLSLAPNLTAAAVLLPVDPNYNGTSQLAETGAINLYQVSADTAGLFVAQVHAQGFDTRLSLLDSQGQLLIQSEASSPQNADDRVAMHLIAGDYFLMVQDLNGGGQYTLATTFTNATGPAQPLAGNSGAYSVAVADLTGNSVPDLIVANLYVDQVLVYSGVGDGTYQPPIALPVGNDPVYVTTADLTGNGIEDIITANLGSNDVSILLGNGDGTFQPAIEVPAGPGASSVAIGDFNGDGHPDLAVTDSYSNTVQVLLGQGDGTFTQGTTITTSAAPWSVVAADFDGRGHTDLAVVSIGTSNLTILDGSGDDTFTTVQQIVTGPLCLSVIAADFNGDGLPDLAVASANNDTVQIYRNTGGLFVPSTVINTPSDPYALAAADYNNDGRIDLAVTSYGVGGVSVLLNNGDGTFKVQAPISVGPSTTGIAAADLTGDGRVDLVSANLINQTIDVLLGNGNGTFQAPVQPAATSSPPAVVAADLNGDGIEDLIIPDESTNEISILLGRGDGTFRAPMFITVGKGPSAVAVGDFNGDGIPDLAITNTIDDSLSVLLGVGDGTFKKVKGPSTGIQPSYITAADLNGDGKLDLVVSNFYSSSLSIYYGNGDGTFQSQVVLPVGNQPGNPVVADFNGDGLPDIAVTDAQSEVTIFLATGPETYAPALHEPAGPGAGALAAGDLYGNGKIDLVVADSSSSGYSHVLILQGNGDGTFTADRSIPVSGNPSSLTLADVMGDGELDIITGNAGSNGFTLLVTQGAQSAGIFRIFASLPSESQPLALAVGDFNGDGKIDIAAADYQSGAVSVFFNQGAGSFGPPTQVSTGQPSAAIVSADFNDDGRLDVAVANPLTNTVSILLGNGDGSFATGQTLSVGVDPSGLVVGDFNGDGRPDLAVALAGSNTVMVFLGLGDGTFGNPVTLPVGKAPGTIIAGDFLNNGITDIAVADQLSNDVAVLIGRGDGTFLPATIYAVGVEPVALAAANLSGDGYTSLVTANRTSGDLTVLWGQASGVFTTQTITYGGHAPTALAVGDYNGDGNTDLAVADDQDDLVRVLYGEDDRSFSLPVSYDVGGPTDFMQAASIPAFGPRVFLATASVGSPNIVGLLIGSDGSLTRTVTISLGSDLAGHLVMGDFNGDGISDIAFVAAPSDQVLVRLGSGQGHVTVPQVAAPLPQAAPVVVDWNGDGIPDVFDLNQQGQLLLRLGQPGSPGEFESPQVVGQDQGIAFTDITLVATSNGPELAAIQQGQPVIWLFSPGQGGSAVGATRSFRVLGAGLIVSMTAGNLDNDGLDDLVLVDRGNDQLILLDQSPSGSFSEVGAPLKVGYAPSQVAIADLDDNGWLDLVVSNTYSGDISVFYGGPGGRFGPEVRLAAGLGAAVVVAQGADMVRHTTDLPMGVAIGVFDSSGLPAVVSVQSGADRVSLLYGTPSGGLADPSVGTSYSTGIDPTQVLVSPLTNNGLNDLVVLNQGSEDISIFLNNGHGGFNTMPPVDVGNDPTGAAVRDVNGDGIPDLLVSNKQGDLLIILGNGDGTFKPYERADQTVSLAVGDFNSNGQPAYVLSNTSLDQLTIQYGTIPSFVQGRSQGLQAPGAVAVADLNGDGNPDIIVVNKGENDILVYLGLGGDRFEAPLRYSTGTAPVGLTVADLTGGGVPDLIVANAGSNDLSIFIGVGKGASWALSPGPRLRVGDEPVSTTVADLSGDGIPDIICVDQGSNNVVVLRGLGGGFFADNDPLTFATGQGPILAFVGKFDAALGLGLAVLDSGSNDLTYYSNFPNTDSTPTFIPTGGIDPIAAVMGDYNNDGYDDLVIAHNGDSRITLFEGGPGGLVLVNSEALNEPVRPTGLVISGADPGQIHIAISAAGQDQVITLTFFLSVGTPGSGEGQGGESPTGQPVSSQPGAPANSSFSTDAKFPFDVLLGESSSQAQALAQTATPSGGPAGGTGSVALALATIASTVQPIFNPSLGSLAVIVNGLVELSQVQVSDIMPLEKSSMEAVAVLLVVSSTSFDDFAGIGVESLEEYEPTEAFASPREVRLSTRGVNVERFLLDIEGALEGISQDILGRPDPSSVPTISGADALTSRGVHDPHEVVAIYNPGPTPQKFPSQGPRVAIDRRALAGFDLVSTPVPSPTEAVSKQVGWIRPLCGMLVVSSAVVCWKTAQRRWKSIRPQPIVRQMPSFSGPHTTNRQRVPKFPSSRASRVQDLPPWLSGPT